MRKILKKIGFKINSWFSLYRHLSRVRQLLHVAIIAAVIYIIYLIISFWLVDASEIQFVKLANSWRDNKICHEACRLERRNSKEIIVNELKKKSRSKKLEKMIEENILDQDNQPEFRVELINLINLAFSRNNPPQFIIEYMAHHDGEAIIQSVILKSFTVESLSSESLSSPLMYYFNLLLSGRDYALKQAAVEIISNYPNKAEEFSLDQLNILKGLIFSNQTERRLRQSLILLIDEYYPIFSKDCAAILKTIYKTEINGDEVSRAFAADIFNRHSKPEEKLEVPIVSDTAWDEYYNY